MQTLNRAARAAVCLSLALGFLILPASGQEKSPAEQIAGAWKISVYAGEGGYFFLDMELSLAEGELRGTISESMGSFSNVPLAKILLQENVLSFEFRSVTPPDGVERLISVEYKVNADKMEGEMSVPDLGMIVPSTAERVKK